MIRETKYRAWDKRSKKMCEVISIDFEKDWIVARNTDGEIESGRIMYFELMQFAGLNDEDNEEIFEGYVLVIRNKEQGGGYPFFKSIVEFRGGTMFCGRNPLNNYDVWIYEIKILGNIYENPELLGEIKLNR